MSITHIVIALPVNIYMYIYIYVNICHYTNVPSTNTIQLYSSVWVYEKTHSSIYLYINSYLQCIILIKEAFCGLKVVKVTLHDYIILGSGRPGVFTASSNRLSSSQFLLFCVTSSKAAATKAVRSKVCLGGTAGCRGGGDTLSVSGV